MTENLDLMIAGAGAVFALVALASALRAHRRLRAMDGRCLSLESNLNALRREMEIAASISLKTGRRVKRMEQEYSGVSERVEQVELRGSAQSFDQAIDSARRGSDAGRLAQQFGLSHSEAELVTRLHGRRKSA